MEYNYFEPEVEIIHIGDTDIICTSGQGCGGSACTDETQEEEV